MSSLNTPSSDQSKGKVLVNTLGAGIIINKEYAASIDAQQNVVEPNDTGRAGKSNKDSLHDQKMLQETKTKKKKRKDKKLTDVKEPSPQNDCEIQSQLSQMTLSEEYGGKHSSIGDEGRKRSKNQQRSTGKGQRDSHAYRDDQGDSRMVGKCSDRLECNDSKMEYDDRMEQPTSVNSRETNRNRKKGERNNKMSIDSYSEQAIERPQRDTHTSNYQKEGRPQSGKEEREREYSFEKHDGQVQQGSRRGDRLRSDKGEKQGEYNFNRNEMQGCQGERPRSDRGERQGENRHTAPGKGHQGSKQSRDHRNKQHQKPQGNRHQQSRQQASNRKPQMQFEPYWSTEDISAGLKRGELIQGQLRINLKNYEECFVSHPDDAKDILISGTKDRNRAFHGDIVVIKVKDKAEWRINESYLAELENEGGSKTRTKDVQVAQAQDNTCSQNSEAAPTSHQTLDHISCQNSGTTSGSQQTQDNTSIETLDTASSSQQAIDNTSSQSSEAASRLHQTQEGTSESSQTSKAATESQNVKDVKCQGQSDLTGSQKSVKGVRGSKMTDKSESTQGVGKCVTPKSKGGGNGQTPRGTPNRKYMSLQNALENGSPVVKSLFEGEKVKDGAVEKKILQATAVVVGIIEKKHPRASTGNISLMTDKNKDWAFFKPLDSRIPRMRIPMSECPKDFYERPDDHKNTLFICRLIEWKDNLQAFGSLMRSLGEAGEIEPETEGMLIENDVDCSEFSQEALDSLPIQNLPWAIPTEEYNSRRDFRSQCVFTIDPATARDLDDALSCEELPDGNFEVGVHIADVSYFLKEGTALDRVASLRATSVYLVQKVIPMLPRILCEELCSLNPNEDRLTFSVVWKISEKGEIYEEWFGRSIIRSCCKLAYDHAQGFIEQPDRAWKTEELPPISENFTVEQIKKRTLNLHKIAVNLRKHRMDSGALRLDQVKLQFTLDKDTGMPNGYSVYQQKDSNRLVEEFMLLANMAVAHKTHSVFPEKALLRRHPPPKSQMIEDVSELCKNLGVPIDVSSAGSLQRSLWKYFGDDEYSMARMQVLVSLCSKPMQNAIYFCTGCLEDEELYRHYALNVPLYTHFTSPIRRYADVIVHRTLAAVLGYSAEIQQSRLDIQKQATQCNDKKMASKRVQELSSDLFFSIFVKEAGPFEEKAMVMGVLDKAFDVFIMKFGVIKRVYCDKLDVQDFMFVKEQKQGVLTLIWKPEQEGGDTVHQRITIFTLVNCIMAAGDLPLQWLATIKPPYKKQKKNEKSPSVTEHDV